MLETKIDRAAMQAKVEELNLALKPLGMFPLALVDPKDCLPQKKNARYFDADTFNQLVENIKNDGALESAPLLFQNDELKALGKYEIISGHHRVDAAKAAGRALIIAFVRTDITREQLVSKQLSHNALTGKDDMQILKELFDSIESIDLKLASGLQNEIGKVEYESLNFRVGTFKSFMIMFTPPDIEDFNAIVEQMMDTVNVGGAETEVRLAAMDSNEQFISSIQRIKKVENIKSNAVALHRILKLAQMGLNQVEKEYNERKELEKEHNDVKGKNTGKKAKNDGLITE